jgi:hypothetical protein
MLEANRDIEMPPGTVSLSTEELDQLVTDGPEEAEKQGHITYMKVVWGQRPA